MGTTILRGKFDETDEFGDSADLTKMSNLAIVTNLAKFCQGERPKGMNTMKVGNWTKMRNLAKVKDMMRFRQTLKFQRTT